MRIVSHLSVIALSLSACQANTAPEAVVGPAAAKPAPVTATAETMPTSRDGANDPAIWINTSNPGNSLILGAATEGGLEVYALDGNRINSLPERPITLVDVRYNFPLDGKKTDLAVAYDIANSELVVYAVDEAARTLQEVTANPLQTATEVEGLCMYQSPLSLKYYVFAVGAGMIQRWWQLERIDYAELPSPRAGRFRFGFLASGGPVSGTNQGCKLTFRFPSWPETL